MSRRRHRRPPGAPPAFSAPQPTRSRVQIDRAKLTAGDIMLFLKARKIADDPVAIGALLEELLPALDRIIIGGIGDIRWDHLAGVLSEVGAALAAMSDQKN